MPGRTGARPGDQARREQRRGRREQQDRGRSAAAAVSARRDRGGARRRAPRRLRLVGRRAAGRRRSELRPGGESPRGGRLTRVDHGCSADELRPLLNVADVDPAHEIEVALQVVLRELLVADGVRVRGVDGEDFLEALDRLRVEAVLQLRDPLVVVAAQQVGAGVLVVALGLVDAPEDRDRGLVLGLVVQLDRGRELADLLGRRAERLRKRRIVWYAGAARLKAVRASM